MKKHIHSYIVRKIAGFFAPVKLPEELTNIRSELAHTILITQSHSLVFESLLLSFAQRLGFQAVNRLGRQELSNLIADPKPNLEMLTWASMHDLEKLPWQHEQPQADSAAENSIKVRTLNVFQVKGPIRKWPSFRPSLLWIWGLIPTRRILTVTVGEAINFHQQSSERLLRLIKIDFVRTLKLVRGTPFVPREEQARAILSGPEFEREIQIISERSGVSVSKGRKLAEKAFYELAASPRRFMYDALSLVARVLVSRLFSEIHTRGLEKLIPAIKEHTVILVPMHRSHLDYVLVGYKLFSEKVNPPLVAAGINLAFWPFGFIFRSVGAYFVKRNARDRFHTIVLKRYVSYLVSHGHLQEFFIEGGRSRSGKMLPPKLGLLSTIVDTWKPERARDILFVPVSITYENLVEDEAFGSENSGGAKVRESIGSTIRAFDVFRRRYGEVLIEFGEPISHRTFRSNFAKENATKISNKAFTQDLGYSLCRAIRDQANPGLTSLCYTSLLMANHYGLSKQRLLSSISSLHTFLELLRTNGFKVGTDTPQLRRFISGEHDTLNELVNGGVIRFARHFEADYFFIPGTRRFTADYYRNSVLHYFFNLALFAVCDLVHGQIDQEKLSKLYPYFEQDLLLEPWPKFMEKSTELCTVLVKNKILIEDNNNYSFSSKNSSMYIPSLLSSHLQAYHWVTKSLLASHNQDDLVGPILYEKFVTRLLAEAKIATYSGVITRTEATARSSIVGILSSLEARHLIKTQEGSKADRTILIEADKLSEVQSNVDALAKVNLAINAWLLERQDSCS